MRRAENLLTSLEGILSARVVTTPLGEVSEVHILAQAGLQPKQLVRNIESALLAQLGLKVDHRKISIAQTADVKPIEALERDAVRDQVLQRTLLFENLAVAPGRRPHRIAITVTLSLPGEDGDGGGGDERHAAEPGGGRGQGGGDGAGPAADRLLDGARGRQDRGGVRPGVRLRGGAGAGRAGDDADDAARRRSRRAPSGRRCSRCWTPPTGGRRRAGRAEAAVGRRGSGLGVACPRRDRY